MTIEKSLEDLMHSLDRLELAILRKLYVEEKKKRKTAEAKIKKKLRPSKYDGGEWMPEIKRPKSMAESFSEAEVFRIINQGSKFDGTRQ